MKGLSEFEFFALGESPDLPYASGEFLAPPIVSI